jgi:gliding motility-associated-like protein
MRKYLHLVLLFFIGINAFAAKPGFMPIPLSPPGDALTFDGATQRVDIGNTTLGNFGTGNFTVEAWIRTSAANGTIVTKRAACGTSNFFSLGISGSKTTTEIGTDNTDYVILRGNAIVDDNRWHHLASVRNGTSLSLYVDGVLDATTTISGTQNVSNTAALAIAESPACSGGWFTGSIDEVRLYNTALSTANITADMTNTTSAAPANLQAYYNFDDASGSILTDQVSGANNGTLSNNPTWIESYAMVVPPLTAPSGVSPSGMTINWTTPPVGVVTNYILDVSTTSNFGSPISGSPFTTTSTSQVLTSLTTGTIYYYRVRADKTSVTGQGSFAKGSQMATNAPTFTSFSPSSGAVGNLVTVTGTNLNNSTSLNIGGVPAIIVSNTGASLVGMVMPGASSGNVSVTTNGGTVTGAGTFTVKANGAPGIQQGNKLHDTSLSGFALQGSSVTLSADGNTALVGSVGFNSYNGAAYVYVRSGGAWTQQGGRLTPSGSVGAPQFGVSGALSADGNTALVGGLYDNSTVGAVWVYTRDNTGTWTQQGSKLVGSDHTGAGYAGISVSLSADGNTAAFGGHQDNSYQGAVWVFTRSGTTWTQVGNKLTGSDHTGTGQFGVSVALSADGKTMIIGGNSDNTHQGAAWIFVKNGNSWIQNGSKFTQSDIAATIDFGVSAAINADGTTAVVGTYAGTLDPGAAWVYTKSGNTWTQQGGPLVGTAGVGNSLQGVGVALTADGNTVMVGGPGDNGNMGAAWQYTRRGGVWTQHDSKLIGTGYTGNAGQGSVALSADGSTALLGGQNDNTNNGAFWAFTYVPPVISTTGTLAALSTITGTASASDTLNVSGTNITAGILVAAPTGFEVSTDNTSFTPTVTVTGNGTITSTPIYIRLAAADAVNSYSGNVILSSIDAVSVNVVIAVSMVKPVPVISTTGTLTALSTITGTSSASTNFSISGAGMTAGILVTSPTGFEVSADNITFTPTITVGGAGTIAPTLVYIRLAAADVVNSYSGNIILSSANAVNVNIATISSTVSPVPAINTTGTLTALTTVYGTASANGTFNISGINITIGGILATAPTGFELSLNSSTGFGNSVTIGSTGDIVSTPVYIRLKAGLSVNTYSGNVMLTSSGITTVNVPMIASTVTTAPLTITADDQNKVYGQANPILTVSYNGFVNGDTFANLTTAPAITTTATINSAVNNYAITPSGAVNANYNISYVDGTLAVEQASLTITADNQVKIYGQANPTLTVSYNGFVNGDTFASLTSAPNIITTATTNSAVNNYVITPSGAADANYNISYVNGTLSIGSAPLTITADNQTKVYGQANPILTASYNGFVNGDTFASLTTPPTINTTAVINSAVNSYPITPSGAVDANYNISYVNGTLAVGQAPLTITANNQTKIYGQANPALTVSYNGFVNGDTPASLTTAAAVNTNALTSSPAGNYTIIPLGAVNTNYSINYVNGSLTVNPATLTVTANNQSKVYGQANPALTVSYNGFVNGDTQSNLTTLATAGTNAIQLSPNGNYAIVPAGASGNNYTFNYVNGTLTISQAVLTITADNQSKIYGQPNPTLIINYSGFINGDTPASLTAQPQITTTATTASGAGSYTITVSNAAIANYTINYSQGSMVINKATLTVKPDNKGKLYGTANPALTIGYTGFANGDTQTNLTTQAAANTIANTNSLPGNYSITASGAASPNYNFTYLPGTMTVIPLANADLSNLTVSTGSLSPAFTAGNSFYTASVGYATDYVSFIPAFDATASASINGTAVPNGNSSYNIALNTGNNVITTVVTAQDGTQKTYTITIYKALPPIAINPTNILSPNGDGKNDSWTIKDIQLYPKNKVSIYDMAGRIIYSKDGYTNDWNGTLNGAPLSQGTYFYIVSLGPDIQPIKGAITILKSK